MPYLLSLGAYLFLLWVFGLSELFTPGNIFVPHDTFYPISDSIGMTAFSFFNSAFNYSNNLAALMVLTPDAVIIGGLKFLFSNNTTQIIHIALCLVTFHSLSFFCIHRIFQDTKLSALLALCYCFSPYSSILYSAGIIYQMSTVVALGILPLFLFKLMNFEPKNVGVLIPLTTLLAFGLLFIYPALLLMLLTLFIVWKREKFAGVKGILEKIIMPKRILSITLLSLPFIFFIYLTVSIGNDKGAFLTGGTSTAIQGGMFYPLMQISAWGLYNIWSPRAILSFYPYFFENPYRILSIALTASLIYFLYKNRKFTPIFFVLFLAFFAKGPNPPFGDLFSFIINYFPFGYMIRSPDSKFGAFIAAWFVVAIYYLHPKQKLIITTLATLFLISNLVGMYANGAISSSKGDQKTTTFIQDPEAELIIGLIEKHTNAVVIGNFPSCAGEWYEDKFHTCQGILIKNLKRHTIQAPGHQLFEVIKNYKEFPLLLLINKRQKESENFAPARLSKKGFEKIYNTSNYELFFRDVSNENCENLHNFSCIKKQKNIIVSIPESAFRFYYPEISYEIINGMVSPSLEPPKFNEERRLIFFWLYIICYVLCLVALFKIYFTRYSHFN
jgi:hypothetical protein